MAYHFRPGQWVKFKAVKPINGAHVLDDGFTVGIYHAPSRGSHGTVTVKDASGKETPVELRYPARVYVVAPNGNNVPYIDADGTLHNAMHFPPETCPELQPISDRAHIPESRISHLPEEWQPHV